MYGKICYVTDMKAVHVSIAWGYVLFTKLYVLPFQSTQNLTKI